VRLHLNVFRERLFSHLFHLFDNRLRPQGHTLPLHAPGKGQHLLHHVRAPLRALLNHRERAVHLRIVLFHPAAQHLHPQRDGHQQVAQVVRDAAHQPADALHALGAEHLALQLLALGDIGVDDKDVLGRPSAVAHERPPAFHNAVVSFLRLHPKLASPFSFGHHRLVAGLELAVLVGVVEAFMGPLPEDFVLRPPREPLGALVPVHDAAIHVVGQDGVARFVQEMGLLADAALGLFPLGDVAVGDGHAVFHLHRHHVEPGVEGIGVVADFHFGRLARLHHLTVGFEQALLLLLRQRIAEADAHHVLGAAADQLLRLRVHQRALEVDDGIGLVAEGREDHHTVERTAEHARQQIAGGLQGFFLEALGGNVVEGDEDGVGSVLAGAKQRLRVDANPAGRRVRRVDAHHLVLHRRAFDQRPPVRKLNVGQRSAVLPDAVPDVVVEPAADNLIERAAEDVLGRLVAVPKDATVVHQQDALTDGADELVEAVVDLSAEVFGVALLGAVRHRKQDAPVRAVGGLPGAHLPVHAVGGPIGLSEHALEAGPPLAGAEALGKRFFPRPVGVGKHLEKQAPVCGRRKRLFGRRGHPRGPDLVQRDGISGFGAPRLEDLEPVRAVRQDAPLRIEQSDGGGHGLHRFGKGLERTHEGAGRGGVRCMGGRGRRHGSGQFVKQDVSTAPPRALRPYDRPAGGAGWRVQNRRRTCGEKHWPRCRRRSPPPRWRPRARS